MSMGAETKHRVAWIATLALALSALGVWWWQSVAPHAGASAERDPIREATTSVEGRLSGTTAADGSVLAGSEPLNRSIASEAAGASVLVFSGGLPLAGALVSVGTGSPILVDRADRHEEGVRVFVTDIEGRCNVPVAGPAAIAVSRPGYYPQASAVAGPGSTCSVELLECLVTTFTVTNNFGQPIEGFGLAVAAGVTGRGSMEWIVHRGREAKFAIATHGVAALAETDATGLAELYLPPGACRPLLNTGNLPLIVEMNRAAGVVEAGGRYQIVASEPLACVFRLQGDDVTLIRTISVGIGFAGGHQAALVRSRVLDRLRGEFPDCVVECGVDVGSQGPLVKVYACGRHSGVSVHSVDCQPASAWKAPRVIDIATGSSVRTSSVEVILQNPDGRRLPVTVGDLLVQVPFEGRIIGFEIPDGGVFDVPVGTMKIIAGRRMPNDVIDPVDIEVVPGSPASVVVQLKRAVYMGRLKFVDANGEVPLRGSVDYGRPGMMKTRLMATGDPIETLFEVGAEYRAGFNGKTVSGTVPIDLEASPGVCQEWTIRVE